MLKNDFIGDCTSPGTRYEDLNQGLLISLCLSLLLNDPKQYMTNRCMLLETVLFTIR